LGIPEGNLLTELLDQFELAAVCASALKEAIGDGIAAPTGKRAGSEKARRDEELGTTRQLLRGDRAMNDLTLVEIPAITCKTGMDGSFCVNG
jgi:hypothetical protein